LGHPQRERFVEVRRRLRVPAALAAVALAGCVASALAMQGMAAMNGPDSLPSFLGLWVVMSAAMMLPSVVPAAALAASLGRSSAAFVSGYFAPWAAVGVVAFEAVRGLTRAELGVTAWGMQVFTLPPNS
jgi:predicted metal-binding membrane protein